MSKVSVSVLFAKRIMQFITLQFTVYIILT